MPTRTGEVLTGQGGGLIERNDLGVDRSEEQLQLIGLAAAGRGADSGIVQELGQTVCIQISRFGLGLILGATQIQDGLGLPLELEQAAHLLLSAGFLGPKLQQSRRAQHLGRTAGILLPRQLQQQLIVTNGLEGRFAHPETIDAAIQDILDRLQLLALDALNRAGRHHLQGQLATPAQIQTQLQWE